MQTSESQSTHPMRAFAIRMCACFFISLVGSVSAQTLGDGLVSYWPLDDGLFDQNEREAVDLKDQNEFELFAPDDTAPWSSGSNAKLRGGLLVDGVDTYGIVLDSLTLDIGTDAVSLALWVKLQELPSELPGGFGGIYDSEGDQYVLYLDKGNNELRFKVTAENGAERPGIPATDLVKGEWLHVVGVYDGAESRIYLNGELKDTHPGPSGNVNGFQVAAVGRNGFQESNFFRGGVDEIAVWSRALSVAEISTLLSDGMTSAFDADADGLRDDWEMSFFGNLDSVAEGDEDGDLLTNEREFVSAADPNMSDTDEDGLSDYEEVVTHQSDPLSKDTDGDGLEDGSEVNDSATDPRLADTDGDGLSDGDELNRAIPLDPLLADTDGDDVPDGEEESVHGTDPAKADTDGDGYADSFEIRDNGDPLDAALAPRMVRLGLNASLVSLWTFDDNVTSSRTDRVQDALALNDLQLISDNPDAAWLDGLTAKNRGSLRVDGANSYVPVPNSASLDGGIEKLTLAAWVMLEQLPADLEGGFAGIFDSVEDAYVFYLDKGNDELRFKVSATGAERPGIPAASLMTGEWMHVVGVYDGVAGTAKIYLNGVLVDTHNNPTGLVKSGQVAAIGRNGVEETNLFAGSIDDLGIWDDALTDAQIDVLFTGVPLENGDSDSDGLPDEWETRFFGNLNQSGDEDSDTDTLTNSEELAAGTSPILADTDEDDLDDGEEVKVLTSDPLSADSDGDLYGDAFEARDGGDLNDATVFPRLANLGVVEGLISFWTMDEAADSREINDLMARNNLVLSDTAPAEARLIGADAKFGNSIFFDGFDTSIEVPSSPSLDPGTAVTLALWVRLDKLPFDLSESFSGIFDSTSDNYVLYLDAGNDELRFKVTATGAERPGIPGAELTTGEWMHVAGVYDGDAGTSKIYLNGVLMDTHNNPTGAVNPGQVATMGRNGTEEAFFFTGSLDDVGIWNVALTEQQLGSLVRNSPFDPNDTDGDGLVDAWEMEHFENLDQDGTGDADSDGLTNQEEYDADTSPVMADSDGDGASDPYELARGTDPLDGNSTPIPEGTGLAAGLIAYWPFDDALGNPDTTTVVDATGVNPLELTFNNPANYWIGEDGAKSGGALQVNGIDSFVIVPSSISLDIGGDAMSISAWLQLSELPSEQAGGFGGIYDSTNDAYVLYLDGGNAELRFKVTASGAERPGIPESELTLNEWIHVVGVYDGSISEARIYLNGLLMDTHAGPAGNVLAGQIAGIGRNGEEEASFFNGSIDDLAIWNRALTPDEVANLSTGSAILGGEVMPVDGFRITEVIHNGQEIILTWRSDSDSTYRVEFNPTLSVDGWTAVQSGIAGGENNSTTFTDSNLNAAAEGYYRVVLE